MSIVNKAGLVRSFFFWGRVEDVNDPLRQDRVRVRVFGYHEDDQTKLPTEGLPWATVLQPTTSAGIHGIGQTGTGLLVGSHVCGFFADGTLCQQPIIIGTLGLSLMADYSPPGAGGTQDSVPGDVTPNQGRGNVTPEVLSVDIPGIVGPLSQNEVNALKAIIASIESGGNYQAVNTIGFLGRYQFGWAALIDVGFVNRTARRNADLNNPSAWTGRMGVSSRNDYLQNGPAQEAAMDALLRQNYRGLIRSGVVTNETPHDVVAGYLAAAHNQGVGGAIQLRNGNVTRDAYGSSTTKFYNAGRSAVQASRARPPAPSASPGVDA